MTIDPKKIPNRIAIDTSVLISAKKPSDDNHNLSRDFWNAALSSGGTVLITAITYAEFTRSRAEHIPRIDGVEVVAFDLLAAQIAQSLPVEVWKSTGDRQLAKVDALVIACAKRHLATHFVTLDHRQNRIAEAMGLIPLRLRDLLKDQQDLPL